MTGDPESPVLQVVKGDATAEEIAALVAVIAATSAGPAAPPAKPRSDWAHPARGLRTVHRSGPGAWRASGLPH